MNPSANRQSNQASPNDRPGRAARRSAVRAALCSVFIVEAWMAGQAQKVRFVPMSKTEVLERAKEAPASDQQRAIRIKGWFEEGGCERIREQPVPGTNAPNIICELVGGDQGTVIVGARYDTVVQGGKTIDNWGSASLLTALYECLSSKKRNHRFVFVAFADHGSDPTGAEFFAANMNASEAARAQGMVNLGVLGLSPTKIWTSHSDKDMVQALMLMVYALKLPASQVDLDSAATSDSDPFANRQIPQITIHSLTRMNVDAGATPFQSNHYYDSYRLLCGYLSYLDITLKPRPHRQ